MLKKILLALFIISVINPVYSKNVSGVWHNDLRSLFIRNEAIIYTINLRTFSAKDTNKNDLIDPNEEGGNFINAINELDTFSRYGVNTLHLLPITPVGKIKAFGTAGSLYAISSFDSINPQIVSKEISASGLEQAKRFVNECHKRNIRVIVDLPSCGSYDMFLEHPEYFVKDDKGSPVIPLDWTDVRLFKVSENKELNQDLLKAHKKFIDMLLDIGADGVRADVAV